MYGLLPTRAASDVSGDYRGNDGVAGGNRSYPGPVHFSAGGDLYFTPTPVPPS